MPLRITSSGRLAAGVGLGAIYLLLAIAHAPFLSLPFFWDEAGYYVPAVSDLAQSLAFVPKSVPSAAHPPLVFLYVAGLWKIGGGSIVAVRLGMCAWAVAGLLAAFKIARLIDGKGGAVMATSLLGFYPIFFVQTTMVQLDLPVAALSLWACYFQLKRRAIAASALLCLCVLVKGTGVFTVLGLGLYEASRNRREPYVVKRLTIIVLPPVICLTVWLAYHHMMTGTYFGEEIHSRVNISAIVSDPRKLIVSASLRAWHLSGHVGLWALSAITLAVAWLRRDWIKSRPDLMDGVLLSMSVCAVYGIGFSLIGGTVLARYMLPAVSLLITISGSVLMLSAGRAAGLTYFTIAIVFVASLLLPPPYHTALEDTAAYRDFVELHRKVAFILERQYRDATVMTAWPATDELTKPYLGYVARPIRVVEVADFNPRALSDTFDKCGDCVVLAFNTGYEPKDSVLRPGRLLRSLSIWRSATQSFGVRSVAPLESISKNTFSRIEVVLSSGSQYVAVLRRVEARR